MIFVYVVIAYRKKNPVKNVETGQLICQDIFFSWYGPNAEHRLNKGALTKKVNYPFKFPPKSPTYY